MSRAAVAALCPRLARAGAAAVPSVCSAHPLVLEAALRLARERGEEVLVEATCNQVNQEGGYTGMTPAAFRRSVEELAARVGLAPGAVVLGGDHLGPNPWRHLPAEEALVRAERLVEAYARAGFLKLHLDTSMACGGDPPALAEDVAAARAARLAAVAEAAAPDPGRVAYVIGTEVPTPGGIRGAHAGPAPTAPDAAIATVERHRDAFAAAGLDAAFGRAVALVVQPGVEFGNDEVFAYDGAGGRALAPVLQRLPALAFEAHSTDYQSGRALAALVEDGFAILKVGPELTFALREALYALDAVAAALLGTPEPETLRGVVERVMVRRPEHWRGYCGDAPEEQRVLRHFGYSDRVRYYWPDPEVAAAVERLLAALEGRRIPAPLGRQYLGGLAAEGGPGPSAPRDLVVAAVQRVLRRYREACSLRQG
ncbi:MAG TPA: class II D-tagatose-bisphosphate aldolase, non-catalytic subunit [Anaeromyxobacter sp.]|nr:class II D-tagatose-bisphosphate aldolase, non-catalytic subunit [Anaeromyxobacter sp.]